MGARVPAIYFTKDQLRTRTGINSNNNYEYNDKDPFSLYEPTKVEINQLYIGGKYMFNVIIGGVTKHSRVNENPKSYTDVKVYASNPWMNPANAAISDLFIWNDL